ncbi:MAG: hypothetical protein LH617_08125, partial [Ramlibacter sp.]|nr:hypothetical protein [Ramlibacter sp.]
MVGGIRLEWCADEGWNTRAASLEYAYDAVKPDRISGLKYSLGLAQMLLASELTEIRNEAANGHRLTRILKQSYGCYYVSLFAKGFGHGIA